MTDSATLSNLTPEQKREMLAELLRQKARNTVTESPLSYGQRALWFVQQLDLQSSAYNVSLSVRIRARVDGAALKSALSTLVQRHASLRTTFDASSGEPRQAVRGYVDVPFTVFDTQQWSDHELQERIVAHHRQPFDLQNGPACRAALFSRGDADHVLLFSAHHIVIDGWSIGILSGELQRAYAAAVRGGSPALPQLTADYTTFVEWQQRTLAEEGSRMEAFWREALAPPLPVLDLPPDHTRPAVQTFKGGAVSFALPSTLAADLDRFAKSEGATLFAVLVAGYFLLLSRYSGQDDIVVGSPALGRSREEFEGIVGYFVNPIALRGNVAGDPTFREFLARVKGVVQRALANQDFPFPLLVERLHPKRDPSRSPVFQAMFNLMRANWLWSDRGKAASEAPLPMEPFTIPQEEGQFDIALDVIEAGGELGGMLRFSSDLFEQTTVERLAKHYAALLQSIVAAPETRVSALSLLNEDERRQVLVDWNATALAYDRDESVEKMIADQARRTPDATAVTCEGQTLTYRELDAAANQLARRLRDAGVGHETLVGICLQRSVQLPVALLGVLKSGGAYVPLDPSFPAHRLELMVEDSALRLIVTDSESEDALPQSDAQLLYIDREWDQIVGGPGTPVESVASGDDLAYLLYTSGSTGKPKGVQIPRAALTNFIRAMQERPGIGPDDVLLAVTTLSFDIAGLELFVPLSAGATVALATHEQAIDGIELRELIASCGATVLQATPATWRLLIDAGWEGTPGLTALCGGEPLPPELASQLLDRTAALWNMYGPTETTIWSTVDRVTRGDRITVGKPIANTQVYVVDEALRPVPVGLRGEICIGGDGVARGYRDRPELTADRFVTDPFSSRPGARMYRTGDIGRWLADGRLDCLGRVDQQVKVRGFRIELGEVEAVLERHDAVRQAVATVHADGGGDRRLVAYVVYQPGAEATASELRRFARQDLPDYMVPSLFVTMDAMPLTPNGKVDRRALPSPVAQQQRQTERVAPRTPMEQLIGDIWKEVLGQQEISVHDNFFDIGGHSLLSMQVIAKVEKRLGIRLNPTRFIMDTLEQISASCEQMAAQRGAAGRS